MEELYQEIERRIRQAGYPGEVRGDQIYRELNDEIEGKENGTYLFMVKKDGDCFYEYQVMVGEENFNLLWLAIHEGSQVYHIDFDAPEEEAESW